MSLAFLVRSIAALIVGAGVASIAYWVGAVIALIAMHGIPLGSAGGPPTRGDLLVHLSLAAAGTFAGARLTMRIAAYRRELHAVVLGLLLATVVLFGFSKPTSNWPEWFGAGMAAACILGSVAAAAIGGRARP